MEWLRRTRGASRDQVSQVIDTRPIGDGQAWVEVDLAGTRYVIGLRRRQAAASFDGWSSGLGEEFDVLYIASHTD